MPYFSLEKQTDVTIACFALHNYVRRHTLTDVYSQYAHNHPAIGPDYTERDSSPILEEEQVPEEHVEGMLRTRDNIACMLWNARRGR